MEWAYIAGFFDGEGNIDSARRRRGSRQKPAYTIRLYQGSENGKLVLEEIARFLGYGHLYEKNQSQKRKDGKPSNTLFWLQFSKKTNVSDFLNNVLPHSIVKKAHVSLVLESDRTGKWLFKGARKTKLAITPKPNPALPSQIVSDKNQTLPASMFGAWKGVSVDGLREEGEPH